MAWPVADRIDEQAAGQERRSEVDGGCEMRCAEMTEPNVSQGAPTAETDDVASWQTQRKRRAMQLKEDRGRPSMGLAKAGFEAAESRLDDFRFSPDSRWANGWPEMGWAGGRGTRPRRTWEDQKTAQKRRTL
ncbi:hypothetical protein ACSS6W_002978 [Trichoderma asperelloides]